MRSIRISLALVVLLAAAFDAAAQTPPPAQPPTAPRPATATPPPGGPGAPGGPGGGQRRVPIQVMTMNSEGWLDGDQIPLKYTQAGEEVSPPFAWTVVPENVGSFVLIARDLDAATGTGTDTTLHWLLWNIPAAARGLAGAIPHGSQLPDGTRQISASGPYYRGPGAPSVGPAHHYVFELYAVEGTIDVPAVGQSPALTRDAVMAAMAGKIRGKAAFVGLFKRP